eukprot:CAMPEP_0194260622 /NCGR_PEP_ID=MMETSP0158-20130606/45602_1 /TAXON_ID=33649 /ORGANISM="Thalassionema nitzschioides, Strain L26-B" /LENGTH=886 /DNA_ID=CAMNT_0039000717 /DNA_START=39 /DNA_END=2698 /DNA_ORIENTATION=-
MKLLLTTTLLCSLSSTVYAFTAEQIRSQIAALQQSETYLNGLALNDANSYQSKARASTVQALDGKNELSAKHVANFYALACFYHATYQVENTETADVINEWYDSTNWLTTSDYCEWFGITCYQEGVVECEELSDTDSLLETDLSDTDDRVAGICLTDNWLTGEVPKELGLLGGYLSLLAVDYNAELVAMGPYDWFRSMTGLKQLFAGTTSFDAEGIPTELNLLTKLEYLDVAWTYWSEGPLPGEAFTGLVNLKYIDIGDNLYDWMGDEDSTLPESFIGLPSLIRLYMDNIIFLDENMDQHNMTLGFLGEMTSIVEAWFDNTRLDGTLPVLPATLKSLSVLNCGLWGTISPLTTGAARLNRVWLTGNRMEGQIPLNIGGRMECSEALPCRLNLECNEFEGGMPPGLCSRYFNGQGQRDEGKFGIFGGDEEQCSGSCCTCVGANCWPDEEDTALSTFECPTFPPKPEPDMGGGFGLCFSGSSTVQVRDKGAVTLSDLSLGDMVQVAADGRFEAVYSFGHKAPDMSAAFLQISTGSSRTPLEISADHMVLLGSGRQVPASMIKKGDYLVSPTSPENVVVTSVKTVQRKGVFAPFTPSGTIVVNDIVASNYIAYQGSEHLKVGSIQTPFTYQWVAHTFNSIHRLAVQLFGGKHKETYTEQGVSELGRYASSLHDVGTGTIDDGIDTLAWPGLAADHMVLLGSGRQVPASMIKKGDYLVSPTSPENVVVTSVKTVQRKGVFAPFTPSGTIVVNDIVASNYIAYQGSEHLKVGSIQTPFTYQWVAHAFNSIHRLAVQLFGGKHKETYTEQGVSNWVDMPHRFMMWVLEQSTTVSTLLLGLALLVVSVARLVELLANPVVFGLFVSVIMARRLLTRSKKNDTMEKEKPAIAFL